jgi:hypothetical protein
LHDIGKLEAYSGDEHSIRMNDAGKLIGEIPSGYYNVRRCIEDIPGFPPSLAQSLLHIILSHHGCLEHGSPVLPATREALLVHTMDKLSGDLGSFDRLARESADDDCWSRYDRALGRCVFLTDISEGTVHEPARTGNRLVGIEGTVRHERTSGGGCWIGCQLDQARAADTRSLRVMRRSRLICRFVVLLACCVAAGPIAVATAAVKPTVRSLRARRGAVTVRVSTPASVRLSIYGPVPAGCRTPYCAAKLVTSTTQKVGVRGLTIEFGQALPHGRYLVVAAAVGKHGYVSQPRYAAVTAA